jgi:transcriptional regulator with XRE-family HTH domain
VLLVLHRQVSRSNNDTHVDMRKLYLRNYAHHRPNVCNYATRRNDRILPVPGPTRAATRARRRLGAFLAEQRFTAGKTLVEAGAALKVSDATVSRYESGEVQIGWPTVETLLRLYSALPEHDAEAERLWEAVRDEPPPVRLPAGTPRNFRRLVNEEREARGERALAPFVVPGLAQTATYAEAVINAAHRFHGSEAAVRDVVSTRIRRQKRLEGHEPLRLHAVIDESVIIRPVGGPQVMREQLAHLLTLSRLPHVTVQIVRFAVGAYGTMQGATTILDYPEPGEVPGVYLEYPAGGAWVDDAGDVSRFTAMFEDVSELALSATETSDLIQQRMRSLDDEE